VSITLAPVWRYICWGFVLLAAANAAASAVTVFRPYWTVAALFCWLMKANILVAITVVNVPLEKAAHITNAINWWSAKISQPSACVVIAVVNAYCIVRVRTSVASGIVLNTAKGESAEAQGPSQARVAGYFAYSFFTTSPPFITNVTCCRVVTSRSGSPSTAMMSAHLPDSMAPTLSDQPSRSASLIVAL